MKRQLTHAAMMRLIGRAMERGGERLSQASFRWDISGRCSSPVVTELSARPDRPWVTKRTRIGDAFVSAAIGVDFVKFASTVDRRVERRWVGVGPRTKTSLFLELLTACRKCDACRKHRFALWRARAVSECNANIRTWFGTLTLAPHWQQWARDSARARCSARAGVDFDALSYGEQFLLRHAEINREITKFLKRLRKQTGAPLRYLIVCEQHKSGDPHYHCLVHEVDHQTPIRERALSAQWRMGFSKWRLVLDTRSAGYVTKYLAKSSVARVRASQKYGAGAALAIGVSREKTRPLKKPA